VALQRGTNFGGGLVGSQSAGSPLIEPPKFAAAPVLLPLWTQGRRATGRVGVGVRRAVHVFANRCRAFLRDRHRHAIIERLGKAMSWPKARASFRSFGAAVEAKFLMRRTPKPFAPAANVGGDRDANVSPCVEAATDHVIDLAPRKDRFVAPKQAPANSRTIRDDSRGTG